MEWVDTERSVSNDGKQVFFRGRGDMLVTGTDRPYRNNYVTIFDIQDSKIVRITEYADALQYLSLGILPNTPETVSIIRALGLPLPPST